jgi:endonuclease/exonuclease/phosphatase family metal-dependent hydrolase
MNGFDKSIRTADIRQLLQRSESDREEYPTLLMGDFNSTDKTEIYQEVRQRYHDAFLDVGWGFGFTFPAFAPQGDYNTLFPPLARLDYVFYDDDWRALTAQVVPTSGGSDHRPIIVRLSLTNPLPIAPK